MIHRKLRLNFVRWSFFVTFAAMVKKYTADDLSYIGFVARKFCNLCEAGWEEYVVENAWDLFERRIDKMIGLDLHKSQLRPHKRKSKSTRLMPTPKFWLLLASLNSKNPFNICFR